MANKDRDIKQIVSKEDGNRSSLFKTAVIASPIAIGGGMGISRLSKKSTHFGESVTQLPFNPAQDELRKFTNRYTSKPHSGIFKDWQLDKLAGFSQNTAVSHEVIRSAWNRATSMTDPTGSLARLADQRLAYAQTPQQAINDIMSMVRSSNSVYMQRAASMFLQDIAVLESRASVGLPITTQSLKFPVPSKFSKGIGLSALGPKASADLSKMAELLGAQLSISKASRDIVPGEEFLVRFTGGKLPGELSLRLPGLVPGQPGIITKGSQQQSRYIAGMYGLVEGNVLKESFNHQEWMARRALEDLVPQIQSERRLSDRMLRTMVSDFEKKIIEAPEWVPTLPLGQHPGVDEYISARSQIMRLYGPGGARLNEFQYSAIMGAGGLQSAEGFVPLFPGHSPAQIAKGVAATTDVRGNFFLVPEASPFARRPLQYLRSGSAPTKNALANQALNPLNTSFSWARAQGVQAPIMKAAYVSTAYDATLAKLGVHSEGQLLVSSNLSEQRAVRKLKQFDVASNQLVDLADMIDDKGQGFWPLKRQAKKGTFLGYSPDGRPVVLPKDMNLVMATQFDRDYGKGNFIRVMAEEEIDEMRWSKVFGGAKGMAKQVSPEEITNIMSAHLSAADIKGGFYSNVDAIITMDELKKNRGLHYNQMFTALWEHTQANMASGKQMSTLSSNFADDPVKVIAKMRSNALLADKFSHETMLAQIHGLARGSSLNPRQMGEVFGAVPEVFGDLSAMGQLSAVEVEAISRGVATGTTQLFFEDIGGPGAGNMATIEPRTFELLASPHFGELGGVLQQDFAARLNAAYPNRLLEQHTLTNALNTLVNPSSATGAITAAEIIEKNKALPTTGTTMRVKSGMDVYIPGSSEVRGLAGYKTATGDVITPDLAKEYRSFIETVHDYNQDKVGFGVVEESIDKLKREVAQARIASITGQGGLLRSRLPGSVMLTAVTGADTDPNRIGITKSYARKMFESMADTGLYELEALKSMESRFLAGEDVYGMIGRHPYIGPYSTQFAKFRMIPGEDPIAEFSQKMYKASIKTVTGATEELSNPIRISPLIGMAADVDGDIVSATLAGPQLEGKIKGVVSSQAAQQAYENYAIRSQLLKAKAPSGIVTLAQAAAGDAIKLGITETGRLGRISSALQTARAAVLGNVTSLSQGSRMDALGLLEWLEQTPISGKHIAPGQEQQMIHLLDDIRQAVHTKDANKIAESARAVLASANISGQAALRDGFNIALEDIESGALVKRKIPGLDISKTAENIANATRAYEATSVGEMSASRARSLFMDPSRIRSLEIPSMLRQDVMNQAPFGALLTGKTPGRFAALSERITAAGNKLSAAGKSAIPLLKPLALGSAAAIGLSAILSDPPRALQAPAPRAQPSMRSGSGGAQMGMRIHPEHSVQAEPTARSPVEATNTARVRGPGNMQHSHNVRVEGISPGQIDYNSLSSEIRNAIGENARITSNIRDRRASLTSNRVSDILNNN